MSWLLSAVMSHVPHCVSEALRTLSEQTSFALALQHSEANVKEFLAMVLDPSTTCSDLGQLEAGFVEASIGVGAGSTASMVQEGNMWYVAIP